MLTNLELAQRLRVSIGRLARRLRQQSLGGLSPSQASVLATLEKMGPLSMGTLAQHEGVSRPSATGIVSRMVDRGLIIRSANPSDLRSSVVEISDDGRQMMDRRREEKTAYLAAAIEGLTPEERSALARAVVILERLERTA